MIGVSGIEVSREVSIDHDLVDKEPLLFIFETISDEMDKAIIIEVISSCLDLSQ